MIVGRLRSARHEDGVTLIELSITTMLLGIVLAMVVQVMLSVQTSVELESGRSTRNDRLRLAVHALEREIRSGEVVEDPANESDSTHGIVPGMSLRIRTVVNASSSAVDRCAQWRIFGGRLESREWSPRWRTDADVSGWRVVAEGIVNRDLSPAVTAFTRAANAAYGGRVVEIRLLARGDSSETTTQRIETSVTGRNAAANASSTACDDLPAYP